MKSNRNLYYGQAVLRVMWRKGVFLVLVLLQGIVLKAQMVKTFQIEKNSSFDKVKFTFSSTDGTCLIGAGDKPGVMELESDKVQRDAPEYSEEIVDRTKEVSVSLPKEKNAALTSSISRNMFSSRTDKYTWKVYLSKILPMDLRLNYAVGDTYIDLSDLPVEKLKMKSGSANVRVNYDTNKGNKVEMDTFLIRVDMGTFDGKNLYLCNSKKIIADVGFGKVRMDFADAKEMHSSVKATVCAGKLEVILPGHEVPVKININDSPLCHITIPRNFEKVSDNVFISPGFDATQTNYVSFDVDVALGNIIFK